MEDENSWLVPPGLHEAVQKFERVVEIAKDKKHTIIYGDTGCGKSLFLHLFKILKRREKEAANEKTPEPVEFNVATLEKDLIRSELFGTKKGAFTGAVDRPGLIKKAHDGVLILEEIGELSHENQAKLLTFIEDGKFTQVGSTDIDEAQVQIIGTTNRAEEGAFREDFKARFRFFRVPPLYERRTDVFYHIAAYFPKLLTLLTPFETMLLVNHNWPGNLRELEQVCDMVEEGLLTDFRSQPEVGPPFLRTVFFNCLREHRGLFPSFATDNLLKLPLRTREKLTHELSQFRMGFSSDRLAFPEISVLGDEAFFENSFGQKIELLVRDLGREEELDVSQPHKVDAFNDVERGLKYWMFAPGIRTSIQANRPLLDVAHWQSSEEDPEEESSPDREAILKEFFINADFSEIEARFYKEKYELYGGNITKTAEKLGVSPNTVRAYLKKYEIRQDLKG